MIVGRTVLLAGIGGALGLLGAGVLTRLLDSLLFGVTPTDPLIFFGVSGVDSLTVAGVLLLLAAAATLASWIPARRASRVDPMIALRSE
jgi:ABC-type antimicrobial peptide transport system permease subunit